MPNYIFPNFHPEMMFPSRFIVFNPLDAAHIPIQERNNFRNNPFNNPFFQQQTQFFNRSTIPTNSTPIPLPFDSFPQNFQNQFQNQSNFQNQFQNSQNFQNQSNEPNYPNPLNYQNFQQNSNIRFGNSQNRNLNTNEIFAQLPTFKYHQSKISQQKNCPICLESFQESEKLRILPCLHFFHKSCIDPWLNNHDTCPICKTKIRENI
ncbi:hypothetical protein M0811_09904 [Anaeramoeba ignava]|uniref:RING-type domain-containing protein n=1 Tax=Anaeramoeba ignava TaxID=1746090 RepID=A0A9Q0RAI1_ANAIG|nr:hypothetical protein M0811_09904 [Anaeramoeba ignava]